MYPFTNPSHSIFSGIQPETPWNSVPYLPSTILKFAKSSTRPIKHAPVRSSIPYTSRHTSARDTWAPVRIVVIMAWNFATVSYYKAQDQKYLCPACAKEKKAAGKAYQKKKSKQSATSQATQQNTSQV